MLPLFAVALFVSATLLFWVQPMFSKMVLPLLGGTPAVWNTCLVFYQAALLLGYVYAHLSARWLGVRGQALLHLGWLFLALLVLPIGIGSGWTPPVTADPRPWLLALLLVSVGLPFFVISTTAPMLQLWFAHTGHAAAKDPYFLYAASNLGSMVALLGYPVLLEPYLRLVQQSRAWTLGYGLLAALIAVCALMLWRRAGAPDQGAIPGCGSAAPEGPPLVAAPENLSVDQRLWWVLLAFAPSSLLLGVTTYITTDIAAVPLLWVIPLALYLLSFVLVFARRPPLNHRWMVGLQPFVVLPLAILFLWGHQAEGSLILPLHLLAFFVTAMVCHGELARSRPSAVYLTEFYLWLAVGGVLGGMFNALLAPLVLKTVAEYPLVLTLACLLRPRPAAAPGKPGALWRDIAWPLAFGLALVLLLLLVQAIASDTTTTGVTLAISCFVALLVFSFSDRPLRFGLGVGVVLLAGMLLSSGQYPALYQEHTFFGPLQVKTDPSRQYHLFYHGTTLHGAQSLDPRRRREPVTYFHANGPFGQVFAALAKKPSWQQVAIIGLGTGTLACYGWGGQTMTFYEIDPAVARIARDPRYFTFLDDCPARVEVILGDGRLTLAQAPNQRYDLIIFDAFSSDAVPTHLVSREALGLYLAKLAPGGILVFHISNRFLNLKPVLANLAADAGLACRYQDYLVNEAEQNAYYSRAMVVVMARQVQDLGELGRDSRWTTPKGDSRVGLWTDEFSNILRVFCWPEFNWPFKLPW